jgi:MSHA biogenesis protein MshN
MQQATPGSDMQTAQAEANLQPIPPSQTQLPAVEQKPPTAQTQTTQPATLMSPPASPAPASAPARPDALKLATEIATPIPTRRSKATGETGSRVTSEPSPVVKRSGNAAPKPAIPPVAVLTPPVPAAPTKSVAAPVPQSKDAVRTPDAGLPAAVAVARPVGPLSEPRIEKRDSVVAPQTAEGLYRRGVGLINQGRVSEGTEDLRGALSMDARHDAARQTLIAMLLDQKRQDEAAVYLQQGLALNPANTAFAMLLARIMVERQDVQGALSLLQKHAAAASNNAEYRAFEAALLQRQSRHKEAAEEYAAALRISPQAGMWWVGLGISQEALEQRAEALESFQRARQTRSLNADVLAYVDQRVKQLQ